MINLVALILDPSKAKLVGCKLLVTEGYVLREVGRIPTLEQISVDTELTSGQVLVEMRLVGLCATQIHEIFTATRNERYMPHLLGHEGVGKVIAVGPDVSTKQVGDICVLHWRPSSLGQDALPGNYFSNKGSLNAGRCVALSRHVVVPENRLTLKPHLLSELESVILGCSAATGWGSVVKVGQPLSGESAVVVGLGSVGISAALALVEAGIQTWGIDPKPLPESLTREVGLSAHFSTFEQAQAFFGDRAGLDRPTHIFDTSGSAKVVEWAQEFLPMTGVITLIGMPQSLEKPTLDTQKILDGLRILGSNGGNINPAVDFEHVARVAARFAQVGKGRLLKTVGFEALSKAVQSHGSSTGTKFVLDLRYHSTMATGSEQNHSANED